MVAFFKSAATQYVYMQWWYSDGSHRFYGTVSLNYIISVQRPTLLFILVPLVEAEPAENITFVIEPADQIFESHHRIHVKCDRLQP